MTRCVQSIQRLVATVYTSLTAAPAPRCAKRPHPPSRLGRNYGTAQETRPDEAHSSHKPPPHSLHVIRQGPAAQTSTNSQPESINEHTEGINLESNESLEFILAGYEGNVVGQRTAGDDALDKLLSVHPGRSTQINTLNTRASNQTRTDLRRRRGRQASARETKDLAKRSAQRHVLIEEHSHPSKSRERQQPAIPVDSVKRARDPIVSARYMRRAKLGDRSGPSSPWKTFSRVRSRIVRINSGRRGIPKAVATRYVYPTKPLDRLTSRRRRVGRSRVGMTFVRIDSVQRRTREAVRSGLLQSPDSRAALKRRLRLFLDGARHGRKVVPLTPSRDDIVLLLGTWNPNFARIHRKYDTILGDQQSEPPILKVEAFDIVNTLYLRMDRDNLKIAEPVGVRGQLLWTNANAVQILLWFLYYDKWTLPTILEKLHTKLQLPLVCLSDCLMHLVADLRYNGDVDKKRGTQLVHLIEELVKQPDGRTMSLQSGTVRNLMRFLEPDEVNALYRAIKTNNVDIAWHTYLHFSNYFAKHDHFDQALDAILSSHAAGADMESYAFLSVCATLLRRSVQQPGGLRVCLRIIPNFVNLGLKLNIQLCNIILLNAVEVGDLKTAFSIHESLLENGLRPDRYTFAILLKACKIDIGNAEILNSTIRSAVEKIGLVEAPVVATEILHCLVLHHMMKESDANETYETIVEAYLQLFNTEPLRQLGLHIPARALQTPIVRETVPPTKQALNIVLAVYVRPNSRTILNIRASYRRFRDLAEQGVQPFAELATTDYFANSFLMAFTQRKRGLVDAAQVVRDMQRPLPESAGVKQCAPTVQTWSILLAGFNRHRQYALAEKILDYMKRDGITPNVVTMNMMLYGYASDNNVDGMANTVRSMDEHGLLWDKFTHKSINRLPLEYRHLFDKELEREHSRTDGLEDAKDLDFSDEIKGALVERVRAFEDSQPGNQATMQDNGSSADPGLMLRTEDSAVSMAPSDESATAVHT